MAFNWIEKLKKLNMGELLNYISPSFLETISWLSFIKQSGSILNIIRNKAELESISNRYYESLGSTWSNVGSMVLHSKFEFSDIPLESRKFWAKEIWRVFIHSIINLKTINLDFRPDKFFISSNVIDPKGKWVLSKFFHKVDPKFARSIERLLKSHFEQRPKELRSALIEIGLLGSEKDDSVELEKWVSNYFGTANSSIKFNRQLFKMASKDLFKYVQHRKMKLPADFLWLGFAVAGICEVCEILDVEVDIGSTFSLVSH